MGEQLAKQTSSFFNSKEKHEHESILDKVSVDVQLFNGTIFIKTMK